MFDLGNMCHFLSLCLCLITANTSLNKYDHNIVDRHKSSEGSLGLWQTRGLGTFHKNLSHERAREYQSNLLKEELLETMEPTKKHPKPSGKWSLHAKLLKDQPNVVHRVFWFQWIILSISRGSMNYSIIWCGNCEVVTLDRL